MKSMNFKLSGLFGKKKKSERSFDEEKAYRYFRQGVMAGGNFRIEISPAGVLDYYSYTKPVSENECGMRDKGADIYFVGLKKGTAEVTAVYEYPTCEAEESTFTLRVTDDLRVLRTDKTEE